MNSEVIQGNGRPVVLRAGGSSLVLRPLTPDVQGSRPDFDWAWIDIVHLGQRHVLGGDRAENIRRNFLAGLDPQAPHHQMSRPHPGLGAPGFRLQGLASTSEIFGAYLPDGTLRLLVLGSQDDHDLLVTLDLSPLDRARWQRQVSGWRYGARPSM